MIIRIAQQKDLNAITQIYNEAIQITTATFDTKIKTVEERQEWLLSHDEELPIWVCEVDGKIAGWACLSLWSDRCAYSGTVENSVYILKDFQGKGCGKKLMKTLVDFARKKEYRTIIARISDGNEASIHIHKQFGFQDIGVMKKVGLKFNREIDVHLMQLLF